MKEIKLEIQGKEYQVKIEDFGPKEATISVNGTTYSVGLKDLGEQIIIEHANFTAASSARPQPAPQASTPVPVSAPSSTGPASGSSQVVAPLPGLILNVLVKTGDKVNAGQKIMIMEAMKMENDITAGISGTVKTLNVKNGDNISEGDILAVIE
ncbi:MAG TPA: biotin/lipoyl-binding protein [Clostridiales bacterium]|nr:biotin/lipoyl-binding protein [Clostridiales bacterium]